MKKAVSSGWTRSDRSFGTTTVITSTVSHIRKCPYKGHIHPSSTHDGHLEYLAGVLQPLQAVAYFTGIKYSICAYLLSRCIIWLNKLVKQEQNLEIYSRADIAPEH
jgi:hypothetical protein